MTAAVAVALMLTAAPPIPATAPGQTTPGQTTPGQATPGQTPPNPVIPPVSAARTFTGTSGLIFSAVRPERVVDFETVIAYLQEAQRTATDPAIRRQAQGWRVFKATEAGPNGSILYVFVIDPVVAGADYSLWPLLSASYPDRVMELYKLYTGALIQQSLVNLTPFAPPALQPSAAPTPAPGR